MLQLDGNAPRRMAGFVFPMVFFLAGDLNRRRARARGSQMVLYLRSVEKWQVPRNFSLDITQPVLHVTSALCPRLPVFMVGLSSSSSLAEEAATKLPRSLSLSGNGRRRE